MFSELDKLVEQKYLRKVFNEDKTLVLYNYTDKCTYDRYWNELTLNARGTVYDISTGDVIAKSFPKFFNFGELHTDKQKKYLEVKDFEVYEKFDGSLGIVYFYDGKWNVNTRGSFSSDQDIRGEAILETYNTSKLKVGWTYLVEIIYPENRIIVDYGKDEKLVLLSAYMRSGMEVSRKGLVSASLECKIPICGKLHFDSVDDLILNQHQLPATEEGYVLRTSEGYRMKFKSKEYLAIARIMSTVTPLSFWKIMKNGQIDLEFLEHLPEEFRDLADEIKNKLINVYNNVKSQVFMDFISIPNYVLLSRKELGLWLKSDRTYRHKAAMFSVYLNNGEAIDKYIMKTIRPVGNQEVTFLP